MVNVIAELCQNHLGDRKILDEMIAAAADAGADYAKIQSMLSSEITKRERFEKGLVEGGKTKIIKRPFQNEVDRLKPMDLYDDDHFRFIETCEKYRIKPLTTIFTRERLSFIKKLKLELIKVSSFDCASFKLIDELSKSNFDKIIVSTGATFDREIEKTVSILKNNNQKFALLHCVSIYPTPLHEAHLNRISYLKSLSEEVGISDHSNYDIDGPKLSLGAVYFGATIIEKHFTILDKPKTKDGIVSANHKELKELVELSKLPKDDLQNYVKEKIPELKNVMLGKSNRELSDLELLNRDYYQGRFASKNLTGKPIFNWDDQEL